MEVFWRLDKPTSRLELIRIEGAYKGGCTSYAGCYHWQVEITQKPEIRKASFHKKVDGR